MRQTKTNILCINTNHVYPYLPFGLTRAFLFLLEQRCSKWSVLNRPTEHMKTDNPDSGHPDNIPDTPRLSTSETAGLRSVFAENGRMANRKRP